MNIPTASQRFFFIIIGLNVQYVQEKTFILQPQALEIVPFYSNQYNNETKTLLPSGKVHVFISHMNFFTLNVPH